MSGQSEEKIYKIGQAAKLVGLKSYVLRFWEGEFEQLEPIRTPSGQRLYNDAHIALIRSIKSLWHDEGLTIEGARKRLDSPEGDFSDSAGSGPSATANKENSHEQLPLFSQEGIVESVDKSLLKEIHTDLLALKKLLG